MYSSANSKSNLVAKQKGKIKPDKAVSSGFLLYLSFGFYYFLK